MIVTVTRKHIKRGKRGNPRKCPVALAINDVLPDGYYCMVDHLSITIDKIGATNDWLLTNIAMSERLAGYIYNYDEGETVNPDRFQIALGTALATIAAKSEV